MTKRLIAFLMVLMLAMTAVSFALADDWSGVYGPYCGTNEWGPCPSSGGGTSWAAGPDRYNCLN